MSRIGYVTTHRAYWNPKDIGKLGLPLVRTLCYDVLELEDALGQLPAGVRVIVALNNECAQVRGDWSGWLEALELIRTLPNWRERVITIVCGNELDIWYLKGDLRLTPAFAADLATSAARVVGDLFDVSFTNVGGEHWVGYLSAMVAGISPRDVKLAAFHPYGQRLEGIELYPTFGNLKDTALSAAQLAGRPVVLDESGVKLQDLSPIPELSIGELEHLHGLYVGEWIRTIAELNVNIIPAACFFAAHDAIGTVDEQGRQAFGLRRSDSSKRPAWDEFKLGQLVYPEVFSFLEPVPPSPPIPEEPRYQEGFAVFAARAPSLVGYPLRDERGPYPGQSMQPTSEGVLVWTEGKGRVFVRHDGELWTLPDGAEGVPERV